MIDKDVFFLFNLFFKYFIHTLLSQNNCSHNKYFVFIECVFLELTCFLKLDID